MFLIATLTDVCLHYDRKISVDDHRQNYAEITKDCPWIEISDEHLWFLPNVAHCVYNFLRKIWYMGGQS